MTAPNCYINNTDYFGHLFNLYYKDLLNEVKEATIQLSGIASTNTDIVINKQVRIVENSTNMFFGKIRNIKRLNNNVLEVTCKGYLIILTDRKLWNAGDSTYTTEWTATRTNTVNTALIAGQATLVAGTLYDNGVNFNIKNQNQSMWTTVQRMVNLGLGEVYCTRNSGSGNPELNFVENRGTVASSQKTFTRGSNCGIIDYEYDIDFVKNKIQVMGYGSGSDQIKSDVYSDATSQSDYGVRDKTVTDRNITLKADADIYGAYLLSYYKDPLESFTIQTTAVEVVGVVEVGDLITVVDNKLGINSTYRIKGWERNIGIRGNWVNLFVSNKGFTVVDFLKEIKEGVNDEQDLTRGDTIRQGEDSFYIASVDVTEPDEGSAYVRFTTPGGGSVSTDEVELNLNIVKYRTDIGDGTVGAGGSADFIDNEFTRTNVSGYIYDANDGFTAIALAFQAYTSTATSGGANTLTETGAGWVVNNYANSFVRITSGTGNGQSRTIASNTSDTLTVTVNWTINPDNTSVFEIYYPFPRDNDDAGPTLCQIEALCAEANDGDLMGVYLSDEYTGTPADRGGVGYMRFTSIPPTKSGLTGYWDFNDTGWNWRAGLVCYYTFDDYSDTGVDLIPDESGFGGDSSPTNQPYLSVISSPAVTNGKWGSAPDFDGTADYLTTSHAIANLTNFKDDTAGSISCWFRCDSDTAANQFIFSISNGTNAVRTEINAHLDLVNDYLELECYIDDVYQWHYQGTANETDAWIGNWKHIVIVQDGHYPKVYIDGVEQTGTWIYTSSNAVNPTAWFADLTAGGDDADTLTIGALWTNAGVSSFFNGGIDEFMIYNRALSKEEVRALFEGSYRFNPQACLSYELSGYRGGCLIDEVHWWKCNEGSGATIIDYGSGDVDGTGVSLTWTTGGKVWNGVIDFDGSADYVHADDVSNISSDTVGTVCYWAKIESDNAAENLSFSVSNNGGASIYEFWTDFDMRGVSNNFGAILKINNVTQWYYETDLLSLDPYVGAWLHIAVVQDGISPKIYFNGEEVIISKTTSTDTTKWFADICGTADSINIGCLKRNGTIIDTAVTKPFAGLIQDVRIFNKALTGEEIRRIVNISTSADMCGRTLSLASANISANEPTLVHVNNPPFLQGKFGLCPFYNGINQYSYTENLDNWKEDTTGTLSFWFKMTGNNNEQNQLVTFGTKTDRAQYCEWITKVDNRTGYDNIFSVFKVDGVNQWVWQTDTNSSDLFTDEWVHLAIVQDGVQPVLYINGEIITINWGTSADRTAWLKNILDDNSTDYPCDVMEVGRLLREGVPYSYLLGAVDDLRIYNRALSNEEVRGLYHNKIGVGSMAFSLSGYNWNDKDTFLICKMYPGQGGKYVNVITTLQSIQQHDDHDWTLTAGVSESSLPGGFSYDIYVGASSADPDDDEMDAWQAAAQHYGSYNDRTKTITMSDDISFSPDTRYTIKIKATGGTLGLQANVQTRSFHDET